MSNLTLDQLEALAGTHSTHAASDVKSDWRKIVEEAEDLGPVIVTNDNKPEAVVLSVDQYATLKASASVSDPMRRIRAELDQELAVLRAPGAADRLREVFASSLSATLREDK
ncbi:MAG TPA: type II toxin-antitoxin system prevent-host-death family antitoxin [Thermoanaerobaculia bacterium]|nr:type II toxin-antitoxin system prevent-host-death family antitoxin [Thermoanaerobaculia bacterium]